MTQVLEGTWDEIAAHKEEWDGKRLRVAVEVLDAAFNGNATDDDFSLAERLRGRVGRVVFEPDDVASRADA